MQNTSVVIGANFGDEGKGLMTDYLCAKDEGQPNIVIRFNGGAQAGHTVHRDGKQHVFGHFGSNSLIESTETSTFLSRFFLINPMVFRKEEAELRNKVSYRKRLIVYVDQAAKVTTPFDMIINQLLEQKRSNSRHGSCGLGIGETEERSLRKKYLLLDRDIRWLRKDVIKEKLLKIRDEWFVNRAKNLGLIIPDYAMSNDLINSFMNDVEWFTSSTYPLSEFQMLRFEDYNVVFEGAQGLMLDQDAGYFPHVTRSNTGLQNVANIIKEFKNNHIYLVNNELDVYYMTRAYMTRHGAGPFPSEMNINPWFDVIDPTNVPNNWQGSLRFGLYNRDIIRQFIYDDMFKVTPAIEATVNPKLVMTCVDQMKSKTVPIYSDGETQFEEIKYAMINTMSYSTGFFVSEGPSAENIRKL